MAIQLRASLVSSAATGTSHTFTKPSSPSAVVDGDFMLLQLAVNGSTPPDSVPSGWTLCESIVVTSQSCLYIYTKTAASEPADYTFTFPSSITVNGGIIAWYSDTALLMAVDVHDKQTNTTSTNRTWPSVTTTVANTVLNLFALLGSATNSTPPGGTTERWDASLVFRVYLMTEAVAAVGATGTRVATGTTSPSKCITVAIAESIDLGDAALTLGAITLAAAGAVAVKGAASLTLGAVTLSASQGATAHGTAALVLGAVTAAAVGVEAGATPSSFAATVISGSRVDLSWVHDGVRINGFSIERSTSEFSGFAEIATPGASDRSYSDTGLSENTRYYWRIRAYRS